MDPRAMVFPSIEIDTTEQRLLWHDFRTSATGHGRYGTVTNHGQILDKSNTGLSWQTFTSMRKRGTVKEHIRGRSEMRGGSNNVRLALLGGFECISGGRSVLLPLGSQRLLALLALRGADGIHRTVAGERLWHDSTAERAAANLRSALWRGRRLGSTTLIDAVGPRLRLAPEVDVDLRQILAQHGDLAHPGPSCHGIIEHLALVEVLTRRLLPEWSEDWLELERGRWEEFRLHALENLAGQLLTEGRYLDALQTALAATSIEPIRETAHRIVIEVHLAEGNTASALKYYQYYRELLRGELGVAPSARLDQLVQGLIKSAPAQAAAPAMSLCTQQTPRPGT